MLLYIKISIVKTKSPNETNAKPIAHPALKATLKAGARPYLAQKVVLKLVWVAITMPQAPETIEMTAPTAKAKAVMIP